MEKLTKREITALKFAIDTMERNAKRYAMTAMYNGEERISFGEAINILEEIIDKVNRNLVR